MASEKALYWIGVGLLALFVSNHVALRHRDQVRCVLHASLSGNERLSGHASRMMAAAEMLLGQRESRFDHAQLAVDSLQTRLASAQCALTRREAAFARVRAEHARIEAMQQLRSQTICPRQSLRIVIPDRPSMPHDGTI
jgi:hypothetical protein